MKRIAAVLLTDTHLKETNININLSVFKQTIEFCKENNLNTIYHLGDIFNSRKAQPLDVLQAFLSILNLLHESRIVMITISGNHDRTNYDSEESFIDPFKNHPALKLITTWEEFQLTDNISVTMIPFFSDEIYKKHLAKSEKIRLLTTNTKRILLTHIGVNGAIMNNGVAVDGILSNLFEPYTQVFCGHYHDKQMFDKFTYIGSSIQHNYGEDPEKGLSILYDDLSIETKVLNYPKYHKIETDVSSLTIKDIENIQKEVQESGDNIRIILTGNEAEIKSFNKQSLLAAGVSVAVKQDEITRDEIDERAESFTHGTLLEQFDLFCNKNKLDIVTGKKYLLKALEIAQQNA